MNQGLSIAPPSIDDLTISRESPSFTSNPKCLRRLRLSNVVLVVSSLAAAAVLLAAAPAWGQVILRVDDDTATTGGNGSTWSTAAGDPNRAFKSLQDALAAASPLASGGSAVEIWVAAGKYTPAAPGGARSATFQLVNGVAIYGGFAGTETLSSQRPLDAQTGRPVLASELSGDLSSNDAAPACPTCIAGPVLNPANGHYYYLLPNDNWTNSEAAAVALGGYLATVKDAAENQWISNFGGPNRSLWLGLTDQASEGNFVWTSGEPVTYTNWRAGEPGGGGSENWVQAQPAADCGPGEWNDLGNGLTYGGCSGTWPNHGVVEVAPELDDNSYHVVTGSNRNATAILDGFTICGGNANGAGGGTLLDRGGGMLNEPGSPTVRNCVFTGNFSLSGGAGMSNADGANPTVTNCAFVLNRSNDDGAGILNRSCSATVTECLFDRNSGNLTDLNGGGGGMSNHSSNVEVTGCTFSENESPVTSGGGVYDTGSVVLVSNCTFTHNFAPDGGGVYSTGGAPTLTECTFTANTASANGGAIFNLSSTLTMSNCQFVANEAVYQAGAFYSQSSGGSVTNCQFTSNSTDGHGGAFASSVCSFTFTDCDFVENTAGTRGGAVCNQAGAAMSFTGCTFEQNTSGSWGGAIYGYSEGDMTCLQCVFDQNVATGDGGAIAIRGGTDAVLRECTLVNNVSNAPYPGGGGAIYDSSGVLTITLCHVLGNAAPLGDGGAIRTEDGPNVQLTDSVFSGNSSGQHGGGFNMTNSSPPGVAVVNNCTFASNNAGNQYGGAIHMGCGVLHLRNSIAWGQLSDPARTIYISPGDPPNNAVLGYSDIQGILGPDAPESPYGPGVIQVDPLFANPADPDGADNILGTADDGFVLQAASPCIDSGDPTYVPTPGTTDLAGAARVRSCRIDMGAYEAPGAAAFDCNANCRHDAYDISCGGSQDCNDNGVPDECEPDCDQNGVPDDCEADCNGNQVADVCEILASTVADVNGNGVPDACETILTYEVGAIAPQIVHHAEELEFFLAAPQLGPGVTFGISVPQPPAGPISLNPTSGLLRYTPAGTDVTPFVVFFSAQHGNVIAQQAVEITPLALLPAEATAFGLAPGSPLPDPESRDYIVRSEVKGEQPLLFNTATRDTFSVEIAGKTVVWQAGHPNGLYESYNDRLDLAAFTILAETVIVRSPMLLPQTNVTIRARYLRMEDLAGQSGSARIDTTPRSWLTTPETAMPGNHGHRAGDITLNFDSYAVAQADPCGAVGPVRFILNGGNGQRGGLGQSGVNGTVLSQPDRPCFGGSAIYPDLYPQLLGRILWLDTTNDGCGPNDLCPFPWTGPRWPSDGTAAQPGGVPGNAGSAGILRVTNAQLPISFTVNGGAGGVSAGPYSGGAAGQPNPSYGIQGGPPGSSPQFPNVFGFSCHVLVEHWTSPGANAVSPEAAIGVGANGHMEQAGGSFAWLSPAALRLIIAHARDAYIDRHFSYSRSVFSDYRATLTAYQASAEWSTLPEAERLDLVQSFDEALTMLQRLSSDLDYFGNPAGWVPLLSFELNRALFDQEIGAAMRVLYLSYWLRSVANTQQQKLQALSVARSELANDLTNLVSEYNAAMTEMPDLEVRSTEISQQVDVLYVDLEAREHQLQLRAERNLRGPFWRRAVRTIGGVVRFIPYFQPIMAAVGTGLQAISKIDFNRPLSAMREIKSAYEVFRNETDSYESAATDFQNVLNGINLSTPRTAFNTLKTAGQALYGKYQQFKSVFDESGVPDEKLRAELARVKAEDGLFNDLVTRAHGLVDQQKALVARIAAVTQTMANAGTRITENVLATDALSRDISAGNAILDPRAVQYLDQMERRARGRLLKYHYYMARAYEYRLLQPYPGSLNLAGVFAMLQSLADADSDAVLTPTQFDALKAVYEEQLATITETIFDQYNVSVPARATGVRFNLTTEQLAVLNAGGSLPLNLKDMGIFFMDEEDLRIIDIKVFSIQTHYAGPPPASFGLLDVDIAHSGISRIARNGQTYQFRHMSDRSDAPLIWSTRYDTIDHTLGYQAVSHADQSLLLSLLSESGISTTNAENVLLFSRPGAWADLTVTTDVNTSNGSSVLIDSLRLEVSFDFRTLPNPKRVLEVATAQEDFLPHIQMSQFDQNGRKDGEGAFRRTYLQNQVVTLTAPESYGQWEFERWTNEFGNDLNPPATSHTLQLTLSQNKSVLAHYVQTCNGPIDSDGDSVTDACDNCPFVVNTSQTDTDQDGIGDLCEAGACVLPGGACQSMNPISCAGSSGVYAGDEVPCATLRADANCDGLVNNFDIDPFVLLILDSNAYQVMYPQCPILNGDVNVDGRTNNFDIDPFVMCILSAGCP